MKHVIALLSVLLLLLLATPAFAAAPHYQHHTLHFCVTAPGGPRSCRTWHWRTKAVAPAPKSRPASPSGYWVWVNATGYDDVGPTANGGWRTPAQYGVCAAHPWIFSYGTRIFAPGYGNCVIEDTGGGAGDPWIDFWFPSSAQCFAWTGRHRIFVYSP